jgi:hypothetical protein
MELKEGFTLKPSRGIATLGSNRHVPMHKFDKSALSTDALYNFRTSLSVVVSFLETPKIDLLYKLTKAPRT